MRQKEIERGRSRGGDVAWRLSVRFKREGDRDRWGGDGDATAV